MKKIVSYILVIVVVASLSTVAFGAAPTPDIVVPLWDYTASVFAGLPTIDPDTGIATCTSTINASQYLPVKVVCELQRYTSEGWKTIKSWEATGMLQTGVQGRYAVYTNYWYRVKTTGYVYNNNNILLETTSVTSQEQYYTGN